MTEETRGPAQVGAFELTRLALGPKDILVARLEGKASESTIRRVHDFLKQKLESAGLPNLVLVHEGAVVSFEVVSPKA